MRYQLFMYFLFPKMITHELTEPIERIVKQRVAALVGYID